MNTVPAHLYQQALETLASIQQYAEQVLEEIDAADRSDECYYANKAGTLSGAVMVMRIRALAAVETLPRE
jgi:hypothetical protein